MKTVTLCLSLLATGAFLSGCMGSSGSAPSTAAEIQNFKTNDFSKAPPGTKEKIEAAQRSGGQMPATAPR